MFLLLSEEESLTLALWLQTFKHQVLLTLLFNVFICLLLFCINLGLLIWLVLFCFWDRVSLFSFGYPYTHYGDQGSPASASGVLGLKVCATTPGPLLISEDNSRTALSFYHMEPGDSYFSLYLSGLTASTSIGWAPAATPDLLSKCILHQFIFLHLQCTGSWTKASFLPIWRTKMVSIWSLLI